jgi:hypothetical protein
MVTSEDERRKKKRSQFNDVKKDLMGDLPFISNEQV